MGRLKRLDEFIVAIEDSNTLLKLYLQRVARSPGNINYLRALAEHAAEIGYATQTLDSALPHEITALPKPIALNTVSYVSYLVELAGIINHLATKIVQADVNQIIESIDLIREGVGAVERVIYCLTHTEFTEAVEISLLIKSLAQRIEGDIVEEFLIPEPTQPIQPRVVDDRSLFEEEDPFDEPHLSGEVIDEIVENLELSLNAVIEPDAGFKAALQGEEEYTIADDSPQMQELFGKIAAGYLQPVKGFIKELREGLASKDWINLCHPALESISNAALSMNYEYISELIDRFDLLLTDIQDLDGRLISTENKAAILAEYAELETVLPAAFIIDDNFAVARSQQEGIIINSLLKQIKHVGPLTINKLFAAGLTTLQSYYKANPKDLMVVSGIRLGIAERICQHFQAYQMVADAPKPSLHDRLQEILEELKRQQFLFKKATLEDWYANEESEHKKRCRRERQQVIWRINLILAETGTPEALLLVKELKKHVFEQRIELLQEYINKIQ